MKMIYLKFENSKFILFKNFQEVEPEYKFPFHVVSFPFIRSVNLNVHYTLFYYVKRCEGHFTVFY